MGGKKHLFISGKSKFSSSRYLDLRVSSWTENSLSEIKKMAQVE